MTTIYHVFTNERDEWTRNYKKARAIFRQFVNEHGNARLYVEQWDDIRKDDEPAREDCLHAVGAYPL